MAFGTEELRVLRRALALALNPSSATAEDIRDCPRLARSVDEAAREGTRLRGFLLADLARYRAALPGTAMGYLTLLDDGHRPTKDDLPALCGNPTAAALLDRCLDCCGVPAQADAEPRRTNLPAPATVPASRTRLTALPGGRWAGTRARTAAQEPAEHPVDKPARPSRPAQPAEEPAPSPQPKAPSPSRRPIPTPGEVFPPKRKPGPPANPQPRQRAAG